jgi:NAD(P)H-hydrate epimerase
MVNINFVKSSDKDTIIKFLKKLNIPKPNTRKGDNGRALIIGGSKLFHSAPLWSAKIAVKFNDIVHLASVDENKDIFKNLKVNFTQGIVIDRSDISSYLKEDDIVLIGPGMLRDDKEYKIELKDTSLIDLLNNKNEAVVSREITHFILKNFKDKKIVLDAGALQMADPEWFKGPRLHKPVITPHIVEFERLFHLVLPPKIDDRIAIIANKAREHECVILFKSTIDIISDGEETVVVSGGNQGLTKGGTGDILSGLVTALAAKSPTLASCAVGSYLIKTAADELFNDCGIWYDTDQVLEKIPNVMTELVYNKE